MGQTIGSVMQDPNDINGMLFRWKDYIEPVLKHPEIHIRDKALTAVVWESHPQVSELSSLQFSDVENKGDHMVIHFTNTYDFERSLRLRGSMPYLEKWMQAEHPVTELVAEDADPLEEASPETWVWTQTDVNKPVSIFELGAATERAAKRADVPTEFTISDIRRSREILVAMKMGQFTSTFRERFGLMAGESTACDEILNDDGLKGGIQPHPLIQCPECEKWAPQYQPCLWCGASGTR